MKWSVGVTTVPERGTNLLPQTLRSLAGAGFCREYSPRVFCDGAPASLPPAIERGHRVTYRGDRLGAFGNWVTALWELYLRTPDADRFAMFQDDVLAVRDMRLYLEEHTFPTSGYWNLLTFGPPSQRPAPAAFNPGRMGGSGWEGWSGWYPSNQRGQSACGLVFDLAGVRAILSSPSIAEKPTDRVKGWRTIDGAVVEALVNQRRGAEKFTEHVHHPSLLTHEGRESVVHRDILRLLDSDPTLSQNDRERNHHLRPCPTFPGEGVSALTFRDWQ